MFRETSLSGDEPGETSAICRLDLESGFQFRFQLNSSKINSTYELGLKILRWRSDRDGERKKKEQG